MADNSKSFWSKIKRSIESDYLGKPLNEEPGLIETISEEVLSKFVKAQRPVFAERREKMETQIETTEIQSKRNELLQQIQLAVRSELDKGKTVRRITNIIVWIITLIAGGFVGVLFQKYVIL